MERDSRGPILAEGQYTMRVARIDQNDRTFKIKDVQHHLHRIFFEIEGDPEYYPGEYITHSPVQNMFTEGEVCCFRVTNKQRREIEKCVPAGMTGGDDDQYSPMPLNVGGRSYTFAMAWAKDLAVAAMRVGHLEYTDDDLMHKIKSWAWEMHQWLLDPKDPNEEQGNLAGSSFVYPGTATKPF